MCNNNNSFIPLLFLFLSQQTVDTPYALMSWLAVSWPSSIRRPWLSFMPNTIIIILFNLLCPDLITLRIRSHLHGNYKQTKKRNVHNLRNYSKYFFLYFPLLYWKCDPVCTPVVVATVVIVVVPAPAPAPAREMIQVVATCASNVRTLATQMQSRSLMDAKDTRGVVDEGEEWQVVDGHKSRELAERAVPSQRHSSKRTHLIYAIWLTTLKL